MKNEVLRLEVQRWDRRIPASWKSVANANGVLPLRSGLRDWHTPRILQRLLEKNLRGYTVAKLTTAMDLGVPLVPSTYRGLLRQGQSAIAVLA